MSTGLPGTGPRDATRGGVNEAALPAQRGRESPLLIDAKDMLRDALMMFSRLGLERRSSEVERLLASMN